MLWRLIETSLRAGALACGLTSLWLLAQLPFAAPLVDRGEAEVHLALERAMARQITPDWLLPRIDEALADNDGIALESYLGLAKHYNIALGADRIAAIEALNAQENSLIGRAQACTACAWDIEACDSLKRLAACALPVELTPVGDLNALRRAGADWATGAEVDRIEAGLAGLGLGASAALLVSGGTSAVAKFGATSLRLGRRMGTVTPGFTRTIRQAVPRPGQPLSAATLAPLAALAGDLGRVREHTSLSDTLLLLRHVDSAGDAARLARLSAIAGADTRPMLLALGKARTFRLLLRLGDLARTTLALLAATAAQLAALALSLVLRQARRQIAGAGRRHAARGQEVTRCERSLSFSTRAVNV